MKKAIILSVVNLMGLNSFASTIICAGGQIGVSQGSSIVVNQDDLKKSPEKGVILQNGEIKYFLTISNIFSPEKDGSETIISKEAMVLSQIKGDKHLQSTVSDGKNLILFDMEKNVSVMCRRD